MNYEDAERILFSPGGDGDGDGGGCFEAVFDFKSVKRQLKIMKKTINNFLKTPYEIISLPFNFAGVLFDTEIISSYTVVCINAKTDANTKATIISSDTNDNTSVTIKIQAGTTGDCHKITVRILSSIGNYFEIDLLLSIAEKVTDSFSKQPGSKFTIRNDFDNDVASSDSLSTATVTVTKISDGSDVTASIYVSQCLEGTIVYLSLQAGTDEEDYIVSVKIVTTNSLQYEKLILMQIREI